MSQEREEAELEAARKFLALAREGANDEELMAVLDIESGFVDITRLIPLRAAPIPSPETSATPTPFARFVFTERVRGTQ